ncbi:MAG: 6,7-dimethyl-8-ribityllumazine synthase [Flavobacteriaceae bacterium]|nr:6,7-dimethyl-8-ribityllumazine synthase [Flavobacteriaceae bacterium]MDH3796383.1 6,7-dimethyl-8-ribityllumazine synthase [Flavobacteriaceae bacterium]
MATDHTNLSEYDKDSLPDASQLEIGLVVSEWNAEITNSLYKGAYKTLVDCGVWENNIYKMDVPGSFELIMGSKRMMKAQKLDAVIAIGSVIQGETRHFEFVCQAVAQGIKDLNVSTDTPVIFCVLTDDTIQQAQDRSGGKHGNKGVEAAIAAIRMATL